MQKMERMTAEEKKLLRVGALLLVLAAILVLVIVRFDHVAGAVSTLGNAVTPFITGVVIAYILNVFVHFFEKVAFHPLNRVLKGKIWPKARRPIAVVLSIFIVLALVSLILFFILPEMLESLKNIMSVAQYNGPEYINSTVAWLEKILAENRLNFDLNALVERFNWDSMFSNMTKFTTDFIAGIYTTTVNVTSGILTAIISFIFAIYFLFGKEKMLKNLKALLYAFLPQRRAKKLQEVAAIANRTYFSFIRGQLLECVIISLMCYLTMRIFRLEYALLISSVVGITALIPIFGAYVGAAFGALNLLLVNPWDSLLFLILIIVLQQIDNNLIYPRVVGSSIGLPAVWTMFAVLFWGVVWGIPGILLGTPTTAVVYVLLSRATKRRLQAKGIDSRNLDDFVKPETLSTKLPEDKPGGKKMSTVPVKAAPEIPVPAKNAAAENRKKKKH